MTDISKYIIELLQNEDKVGLPDLGTFVVEEEPAESHPVTHTYKPATRKVRFTEEQLDEENKLVSALAFYENMIFEKAEKQVQGFVYDLRQDLKETGSHTVKGLGIFSIDAEHNLSFEVDEEADFNNYTFGLPDISVQPLAQQEGKEETKENEQQDLTYKQQGQKKKKGIKIPIWVYVLLPILLFMVVFVVFFGQNEKGESILERWEIVEDPSSSASEEDAAYLSELEEKHNGEQTDKDEETKEDPEVEVDKEEKMDDETRATAIEEQNKNTEAEAKKEPVKAQIDEEVDYHIIAGCFANRKNAEELRDSLKSMQFSNPVILEPEPGKTLYKVSTGLYTKKSEANQILKEWSDNQGKEWWILKTKKK